MWAETVVVAPELSVRAIGFRPETTYRGFAMTNTTSVQKTVALMAVVICRALFAAAARRGYRMWHARDGSPRVHPIPYC